MNERELILALEAADHASPAIKKAARAVLFYGESFEKAKQQAEGGINVDAILKGAQLGGGGLGQIAGLASSLQGVASVAGPVAAAVAAARLELKATIAALKTGPAIVIAFWKGLAKLGQVAWDATRAFFALTARVGGFAAAIQGIAITSMVGGLSLMTKQAVDLEYAMARVRGVTGESIESINGLAMHFRELAKTSIYSASQFAEAGFYMASAGFSGPEIEKSVSGIVKLAEALRVDLGQSAELTMAMLRAYNMEMEDSTRVANALAAANRESMATFEKLAGALRYVAPIAGMLNVRFEETVAALNLLYNTGLRGEQAGVYLRGMMQRLINPSQQATAMLAEFGLTVEDINPQVHGLTGVIQTLSRAQLGAAELSQLFGIRAGQAAMILVNAGAPAMREMEQSITGTNAAFEQAEMQLDTVRGLLKYTASSIEELSHVLTGGMVPALKDTLRGFADFINYVSQTEGIQTLANLFTELANEMERFLNAALDGMREDWAEIWENAYEVFKWWLTNTAAGVGAAVEVIRYLIERTLAGAETMQEIWKGLAGVWASALSVYAHVLMTMESMMLEYAKDSDAWEALKRVVFETARAVVLIITEMTLRVITQFRRMADAAHTVALALAPIAPAFSALILPLGAARASLWATQLALYKVKKDAQGMTFEGFARGLTRRAQNLKNMIRTLLPEDIIAKWDETASAAETFRKNVEGALTGGEIKMPEGETPFAEMQRRAVKGWRKGMAWAEGLFARAEETKEEAAAAVEAAEESGAALREAQAGAEDLGKAAEEARSDLDIMGDVSRRYSHLQEAAAEKNERWQEAVKRGEEAVQNYAEALRATRDRLRDQYREMVSDIKSARDRFVEWSNAVRESMKMFVEDRKANVPLGEATGLAVQELVRDLVGQMRPQQLEAVMPGAMGMGRETRRSAAEQNRILLARAQAEVRRMDVRQIQRLAERRIERQAETLAEKFERWQGKIVGRWDDYLSRWQTYAKEHLQRLSEMAKGAEKRGERYTADLRREQRAAANQEKYYRELQSMIREVSQLAQQREIPFPQAQRQWARERAAARGKLGLQVAPRTPEGNAYRQFMKMGAHMGQSLYQAYEQGRAEEKQEQMRDMSAGAAPGGM
jgi:TP901 family phage tail tape measure protein